MKFLVSLALFACVAQLAQGQDTKLEYSVDCTVGADNKCNTDKNLNCINAKCMCKQDANDKGKYNADVKTATTGCQTKCDDTFKCGDNAKCSGTSCVCKDGYIFDTTYKPADAKKGSFACKTPGEKATACSGVKAEQDKMEIKESKCACKKDKGKLEYVKKDGNWKCVTSAASQAVTSAVLGLVAVVVTMVL